MDRVRGDFENHREDEASFLIEGVTPEMAERSTALMLWVNRQIEDAIIEGRLSVPDERTYG